MLELYGRSSPTTLRALGTTFARLEAATSSSLIVSKAAFSGDPKTVIDWSGEDNTFVGWPAWLTSGTETTPRVPAPRQQSKLTWPGSDRTSREDVHPLAVRSLGEKRSSRPTSPGSLPTVEGPCRGSPRPIRWSAT